MNIGLAPAYATDTGLGRQTYNFYKFMKPYKTLAVDLSDYNHMPVHKNWYGDDVTWVKGIPNDYQIIDFLDGLDIVFTCETPLNYHLFGEASKRNIATLLQPNFEFLDYLAQPTLPHPTAFALPSLWNVKRLDPAIFPNILNLPVPVDTEVLPKREIKRAKSFFHIGGRPALMDRNGTLDFLAAANMCESEADFILYCQEPTQKMRNNLGRVQLFTNLKDYTDLYKYGDVLVMPRKFGGLCLSVNEAIACGIPVLMPDIDPNNTWLPSSWLMPVMPRIRTIKTRSFINVYDVQIKMLATYMDVLYKNPDYVIKMVEQAKSMAEILSWHALKPKYESMLRSLCM